MLQHQIFLGIVRERAGRFGVGRRFFVGSGGIVYGSYVVCVVVRGAALDVCGRARR